MPRASRKVLGAGLRLSARDPNCCLLPPRSHSIAEWEINGGHLAESPCSILRAHKNGKALICASKVKNYDIQIGKRPKVSSEKLNLLRGQRSTPTGTSYLPQPRKEVRRPLQLFAIGLCGVRESGRPHSLQPHSWDSQDSEPALAPFAPGAGPAFGPGGAGRPPGPDEHSCELVDSPRSSSEKSCEIIDFMKKNQTETLAQDRPHTSSRWALIPFCSLSPAGRRAVRGEGLRMDPKPIINATWESQRSCVLGSY